MLLPTPNMPEQIGKPSDYAMARRPVLFTLIVLQLSLFLFRIGLLGDYFGGIILLVVANLGWSALRDNMNVQYICYFGWMCLVNGSFELIALLDTYKKAPGPLFSEDSPAAVNFQKGLLVVSPFVHLPGAVLSWYLYDNFAATCGLSGQKVGFDYGPPGRPSWNSPVMFTILLLHTADAFIAWVFCMDPQCAMWLTVTAIIGWFAWKQNLLSTLVFFFGWLNLLAGTISLLLFIHHEEESSDPLFSSNYPVSENIRAICFAGTHWVYLPTFVFVLYLKFSEPPEDESAEPEGQTGQHESTSLLSFSQSPPAFRRGPKLGNVV